MTLLFEISAVTAVFQIHPVEQNQQGWMFEAILQINILKFGIRRLPSGQ